eukprot:GSA120T00012222001.1
MVLLIILALQDEHHLKRQIGTGAAIANSFGELAPTSPRPMDSSGGAASQGVHLSASAGGSKKAIRPSALLQEYREKFLKYPTTTTSAEHEHGQTTFFNEHIVLGQFLAFVVLGVYCEEQRAYLLGVSQWHVFDFVTAEALGSYHSLNFGIDDGRSAVEARPLSSSAANANSLFGAGARGQLPGFDSITGRPLYGTKYDRDLSAATATAQGESLYRYGAAPFNNMLSQQYPMTSSSLNFSTTMGIKNLSKHGFPEIVHSTTCVAVLKDVLIRALSPKHWTVIKTYEAQTQRKEKEHLQRAAA